MIRVERISSSEDSWIGESQVCEAEEFRTAVLGLGATAGEVLRLSPEGHDGARWDLTARTIRVQINPRRGGRYVGGGESVEAPSVEAAIEALGALPGDALWMTPVEGGPNLTFVVETGPDGLRAVPI